MAKLSARGLERLKFEEGFRNDAYRDSAGYWTIGVGHLLTQSELSSGKLWIDERPVRWRDGISDKDVDALLRQDIRRTEVDVEHSVSVPLSEHQFDALVSFVYNVGVTAFRNSTLRRHLNQGDYEAVPEQLARWKFAGGKEDPILVRRRARESKLWRGE